VCKGGCRTRACPCFAADRECDPDLCKNCVPLSHSHSHASDGSEADSASTSAASASASASAPSAKQQPHKKHKKEKTSAAASAEAAEEDAESSGSTNKSAPTKTGAEACVNMALQTGRKAHLILGKSAIHGWGAFTAHALQKGDLVTEYMGEVSQLSCFVVDFLFGVLLFNFVPLICYFLVSLF
jgi:histone-lysine N-methyltransferase EZH2